MGKMAIPDDTGVKKNYRHNPQKSVSMAKLLTPKGGPPMRNVAIFCFICLAFFKKRDHTSGIAGIDQIKVPAKS